MRSRRIPAELKSSVGLLVSGAGASASVVCAMLFVAPKSITPINDPATPAATPTGRGVAFRMRVVVFKVSSPLSVSWAHHAPDGIS